MEPTYTGRVIGRCSTCRAPQSRESADGRSELVACPCGGLAMLKAVYGRVSDKKCGARCTSAMGATCDCTCGGERHGEDHRTVAA